MIGRQAGSEPRVERRTGHAASWITPDDLPVWIEALLPREGVVQLPGARAGPGPADIVRDLPHIAHPHPTLNATSLLADIDPARGHSHRREPQRCLPTRAAEAGSVGRQSVDRWEARATSHGWDEVQRTRPTAVTGNSRFPTRRAPHIVRRRRFVRSTKVTVEGVVAHQVGMGHPGPLLVGPKIRRTFSPAPAKAIEYAGHDPGRSWYGLHWRHDGRTTGRAPKHLAGDITVLATVGDGRPGCDLWPNSLWGGHSASMRR
jgi:hypothetical protein